MATTASPDQHPAEGVHAIYATAATAATATSDGSACLAAELYGDQVLPEAAAAASLGCADPAALAGLEPGQTVLDLGCGGGLDVLMCARRVGPAGRVIGVDMTAEMIDLARRNADEAGVGNVEFRLGAVEDLPVEDESIDVVIANCAISLSPSLDHAVVEARRVLVPDGRLAVADLAALAAMPASVQHALAEWAGIDATLTVQAYRDAVVKAGFTDPAVRVLRTFGLADVTAAGSTPLGEGPFADIPQSDLNAADGLLASIHVTATRGIAAVPRHA